MCRDRQQNTRRRHGGERKLVFALYAPPNSRYRLHENRIAITRRSNRRQGRTRLSDAKTNRIRTRCPSAFAEGTEKTVRGGG